MRVVSRVSRRKIDDDVPVAFDRRDEQSGPVPSPLRRAPAVRLKPGKCEDLARAAAKRGHDVDTPLTVAIREERNLAAVRRPARPAIVGGTVFRQVHRFAASELHHPDVVVAEKHEARLVRLIGQTLAVR